MLKDTDVMCWHSMSGRRVDLNRDLVLKILQLVIDRDLRRGLGIAPGKLVVPLSLSNSITSSFDKREVYLECAAVGLGVGAVFRDGMSRVLSLCCPVYYLYVHKSGSQRVLGRISPLSQCGNPDEVMWSCMRGGAWQTSGALNMLPDT